MLEHTEHEEETRPLDSAGFQEFRGSCLALAGHVRTLNFLADRLEHEIDKGNPHERKRIVEIAEFVTMEVYDQASKVEALARDWGIQLRLAQKKEGLVND